MSVLICKNIESEGPGTIESFLITQKVPYKIVELSAGESIPSLDNFDTLILMGGPMSVNDEKIYPFLSLEEKLIKEYINKGKKILGICLGAQLIAKALGARVYKGLKEEIGWYDIELTGDGLRDPLMQKLAIHPVGGDFWSRFKVFHWHGETFDIPHDAVRLAKSELYPNQAFRYGNKTYALQFHIEVTREMVYDWFRDTPELQESMKEQTEKYYEDYLGRAVRFYESFFTE
jgi:GMP synthase-like glutamine amidotransferase